MKSIALSIRPEWVCKIANGEKEIEVRSKFPADYVGWVYMYCTMRKPYCMVGRKNNKTYCDKGGKNSVYSPDHNYIGNGKVVGRFWCNRVEEIDIYTNRIYETKTLNQLELLEKSCLTHCELFEYLGEDYSKKGGYAIHISQLEIFDRPRELSEFKKRNELDFWQWNSGLELYSPLTKAPQNYCYIETEEK